MDENLRFIALLDELKAQGLISGYVAVAEKLGTNKAAISDIKGCRKRLSLDLLRSLKFSYSQINLNWVIMGEGTMFVTPNLQTESNDSVNKSLIEIITDKDKKLLNQAEEIGRLKAENAELKRHAERLAALVNTDSTAHVG